MAASDRNYLAWLPALLLLVVTGLGTAGLTLRPTTVAGGPVAAIFPPWWNATESFAAATTAGGNVIRQGAWSNILIVAAPGIDLSHRLRHAGALLLVDPTAIGGCLEGRS